MLTCCLYRELHVKMEYLVYMRSGSRTSSCTVILYMVSNIIILLNTTRSYKTCFIHTGAEISTRFELELNNHVW